MYGYCACKSLLTGTGFYLAPPCKSMYAIIQTRSSLGPGPGIAPGNVPVLIDVPVVLCKYEYHYLVHMGHTTHITDSGPGSRYLVHMMKECIILADFGVLSL